MLLSLLSCNAIYRNTAQLSLLYKSMRKRQDSRSLTWPMRLASWYMGLERPSACLLTAASPPPSSPPNPRAARTAPITPQLSGHTVASVTLAFVPLLWLFEFANLHKKMDIVTAVRSNHELNCSGAVSLCPVHGDTDHCNTITISCEQVVKITPTYENILDSGTRKTEKKYFTLLQSKVSKLPDMHYLKFQVFPFCTFLALFAFSEYSKLWDCYAATVMIWIIEFIYKIVSQ